MTCFCADGDLLSQWRAYAGRDDAGGYALGMGTDPPLQGWPPHSPETHDVALRRVLYNPVEQEETCHELVDALVPLLDADPRDVEVQRSFTRCPRRRCGRVRLVVQGPGLRGGAGVADRVRPHQRRRPSSRCGTGWLGACSSRTSSSTLPCPVEPLQGHLPVQAIRIGSRDLRPHSSSGASRRSWRTSPISRMYAWKGPWLRCVSVSGRPAAEAPSPVVSSRVPP